ncbi:hypothetical protein TDB9533_01291 [Thalassocella blandensis]|nr:hypothetical protein TDB9533_01291 [Thalassocella blandensis]
MLQFEWLWVFFLLPLPLLCFLLLPRAKREEAALSVPFFKRAETVFASNEGFGSSKNLINRLFLALIWLALLFAASKPLWVGDPIQIPASGRDLMLAVDLSDSMKKADMVVQGQQIARILIVKHVVGEFVKRRESDRIGLILFGTNAYLQAPLTFDKSTVKQLLDEAMLNMAGPNTAIGDAIGLAIKRLKDRPDSQRVLILLTDGANTAGEVSPRQAADLAKQAGLKIYTVGIGADEMMVRGGFFGGFNRRVNPSADLDEDTLTYIADTTGGRYFRARNPQELEQIYQEIDKLEPIEQEAEVFRPTKALYYWPLALAFALSLLLAFITAFNGMRFQFRGNELKENALKESEQ